MKDRKEEKVTYVSLFMKQSTCTLTKNCTLCQIFSVHLTRWHEATTTVSNKNKQTNVYSSTFSPDLKKK